MEEKKSAWITSCIAFNDEITGEPQSKIHFNFEDIIAIKTLELDPTKKPHIGHTSPAGHGEVFIEIYVKDSDIFIPKYSGWVYEDCYDSIIKWFNKIQQVQKVWESPSSDTNTEENFLDKELKIEESKLEKPKLIMYLRKLIQDFIPVMIKASKEHIEMKLLSKERLEMYLTEKLDEYLNFFGVEEGYPCILEDIQEEGQEETEIEKFFNSIPSYEYILPENTKKLSNFVLILDNLEIVKKESIYRYCLIKEGIKRSSIIVDNKPFPTEMGIAELIDHTPSEFDFSIDTPANRSIPIYFKEKEMLLNGFLNCTYYIFCNLFFIRTDHEDILPDKN